MSQINLNVWVLQEEINMRGGYRPGAGRPKGSKNRAKNPLPPRPGLSINTVDRQRIADVRRRAEAWLAEHEDGVLDQIMSSGDLRLKFEVLKHVKGYADGLPPKTVDVRAGETFEELMKAIDDAARAKAEPVPVAITAEIIPSLPASAEANQTPEPPESDPPQPCTPSADSTRIDPT